MMKFAHKVPVFNASRRQRLQTKERIYAASCSIVLSSLKFQMWTSNSLGRLLIPTFSFMIVKDQLIKVQSPGVSIMPCELRTACEDNRTRKSLRLKRTGKDDTILHKSSELDDSHGVVVKGPRLDPCVI